MGKHKRKPPVFAGNVARQAQARYLRTKKPESERVQENREAAGHVICLCFMVALNDRYGIGEGRLQRVTDAANGELERFASSTRLSRSCKEVISDSVTLEAYGMVGARSRSGCNP